MTARKELPLRPGHQVSQLLEAYRDAERHLDLLLTRREAEAAITRAKRQANEAWQHYLAAWRGDTYRPNRGTHP